MKEAQIMGDQVAIVSVLLVALEATLASSIHVNFIVIVLSLAYMILKLKCDQRGD